MNRGIYFLYRTVDSWRANSVHEAKNVLSFGSDPSTIPVIGIRNLGTCRWQEATAILERMQLNGIPPDVYSINGAISACGRAGKWQHALDLLAKMEQEGSGVRPDVFSYNSAINALAKAPTGR